MTDESHIPEMGDQGEEVPSESGSTGMMAGTDFSSGEGLVAFAGIVLLAVWIVFDLIVDNYGFDNVIAVLAAAAAIVPRLDRAVVERVHSLPVIMKVLGWALVLFGAIEILLDIRFGVYDDLGIIVAALISYVGYAMALMGARSIEI